MNWVGRFESRRSAFRRSGCESSSVARLYEANRRAKAERQYRRVEGLVRPGRVHGGDAFVEQGRLQVRPDKPDEGLFALLARPPELVVAGLGDAGPVGGPGIFPGGVDVLREKVVHR